MEKTEYLDKNIFYGLKNLNTGFDEPMIKYFSESEFEIVLNRVKELGLGIHGIEPWKAGEYYGAKVFEETNLKLTDSNWYMKAFKEFKDQDSNLEYAATYFIPPNLLILY